MDTGRGDVLMVRVCPLRPCTARCFADGDVFTLLFHGARGDATVITAADASTSPFERERERDLALAVGAAAVAAAT